MIHGKLIASVLPLMVSAGITGGPFGDINGDSMIDGRDASLLLTYYTASSTGYSGSLEQFADEANGGEKAASASDAADTKKAASDTAGSRSGRLFGDISGDGIIDGRDATLLLTYYTATSTSYSGTLEQYLYEAAHEGAASPGPENPDQGEGDVSLNDSRYFFWLDLSKDKNFVFNDQFIKVTFKIKEDAPDNDYTIKLKPDLSDIGGVSIYPDKVIDGTVRVGGESIDPADVSAEEGLTVYGDNVACKQGDTIDYYINIKNNNGLAAALVWFYFDSNAMEFESAEETGEFADMITDGTVKVGARSGKSQK